MRDAAPSDPLDGPVFPSDAVIRTAVHAAAATDKPIRVMDDGRLLGVVDRAHILETIAGSEAPEGTATGAETVLRPSKAVRVEPVNEPSQETAEFLVENLHEGRADS
jgi:hypothetical protein